MSSSAGPYPALPATVSVEDWPVVRVTFERGALISSTTMDALAAHLKTLMELAIAGKASMGIPSCKLHLVMDLGGLVSAGSAERALGIKFMQSIRTHAERSVLTTAIVTASPIVRAVLNIILTLSPPKSETKIFSDVAAADEWTAVKCGRGT